MIPFICGCTSPSATQPSTADGTARLGAQLEREFERLGIDPARVAAQAPQGTAGQVFDLSATQISGNQPPYLVELTWTEQLGGDYDQNSEVNISDLTWLGMELKSHVTYLDPAAANGVSVWPTGDPSDDGRLIPEMPPLEASGAWNWRLARIDGDGNGELNVSDVTPLAMNWNARLDSYQVYRKLAGGDTFAMIANAEEPETPFTIHRASTYEEGATGIDPLRPVRYTLEILEAEAGEFTYYIAPYDTSTGTAGEASLEAVLNVGGPVALINGTREPEPAEGVVPWEATFDAQASYVPLGSIVQFEWDWDGDGSFDADTGSVGHLTHTYDEPTEFTLEMQITDDLGRTDSITQQVRALDPAEVRPQSFLAEMSDGTMLHTHVYLPEGDGPWPVILIRTPYGKTPVVYGPIGDDMNANGYVMVTQDMRGRYQSEGNVNIPLEGEDMISPRDGVDTIAWVLAQPWCDGNIGQTGGSMLGMTQLYTAPHQPDGLQAQFIGVSPASMYHEFVYVGGAFRKGQMESWVDIAQFDPASLDIWLAHPSYDAYWEQFNVTNTASQVITPGMHYGGWFDTFSQGTIDSWKARQYGGGAGAAGRQWLVLGPWTHGGESGQTQGDITFPLNSSTPPDSPYLTFMDYFIKGTDNGMLARSAVTYYVMGAVDEPGAPGNIWRYAADWPVAHTDVDFYLHSDGTLDLTIPAAEIPSSWLFDPSDPTPTEGGRNLYEPKGIFDQAELELRGDNLLFNTAVLVAPLEVTGRVTCRLWVSSDAVDTDIAVRLTDVYPDGSSMLVMDGIRRLRYRDGFEAPVPLVPGEVYEVEIDLWSTSYVFNTGHRLRLAVTSSNYPRWDLNPGTGEMWQDEGVSVPQTNQLYHSAARPSALVLPVPD